MLFEKDSHVFQNSFHCFLGGDKSTSERSISIRSGYFRKAVSYTGPSTIGTRTLK